MNIQTIGIGGILALLCVILCVVFVAIGTLPALVGGLIGLAALSRLL